LVLAPERDYDTSDDPQEQRYGLTTEGARRAATYTDFMKLARRELNGQVLLTLHRREIKDGQGMTSATDLQGPFHEEALEDLVYVLRSLASQGYLKLTASRGDVETDLYVVTQPGHQAADQYQHEGRFPPLAGTVTSSIGDTYNLNGPNSRVNNHSTDSSTNTVISRTGTDTDALVQALDALRAAVNQLGDQDERDLGEVHLAQFQRVVEAGESTQTKWGKLTAWAAALPNTISGAAVVWGAMSALSGAVGHPLPPAPEGLGQ